MNLSVSQATGVWTQDDGTVLIHAGQAWSGNDRNPTVNPHGIHGKNNPGTVTLPVVPGASVQVGPATQPLDGSTVQAQDIHCIGCTPLGVYRFGEWAMTPGDQARLGYPTHLGLCSSHLIPIAGNTPGRTGLYCHGPAEGDLFGQESEGCQVVMHDYRYQLAAMKPDTLTVTP
jgi:hypothetical protein